MIDSKPNTRWVVFQEANSLEIDVASAVDKATGEVIALMELRIPDGADVLRIPLDMQEARTIGQTLLDIAAEMRRPRNGNDSGR